MRELWHGCTVKVLETVEYADVVLVVNVPKHECCALQSMCLVTNKFESKAKPVSVIRFGLHSYEHSYDVRSE